MKSLLSIDLNLLTTLHALLETGSTKEAAKELGRTQSAISHALNRLRALFDDPLFVRVGWRLETTPRAEALRPQLSRMMGDVEALILEPEGFVARYSRRVFRIACRDVGMALLAPLVDAMRANAAHVSLNFVDVGSQSFDQLERGEIDAVISPGRSDYPDSVDVQPYRVLDWAIFTRPDHPLEEPVSIEGWASFPHVLRCSPARPRGVRSTTPFAPLALIATSPSACHPFSRR